MECRALALVGSSVVTIEEGKLLEQELIDDVVEGGSSGGVKVGIILVVGAPHHVEVADEHGGAREDGHDVPELIEERGVEGRVARGIHIGDGEAGGIDVVGEYALIHSARPPRRAGEGEPRRV